MDFYQFLYMCICKKRGHQRSGLHFLVDYRCSNKYQIQSKYYSWTVYDRLPTDRLPTGHSHFAWWGHQMSHPTLKFCCNKKYPLYRLLENFPQILLVDGYFTKKYSGYWKIEKKITNLKYDNHCKAVYFLTYWI